MKYVVECSQVNQFVGESLYPQDVLENVFIIDNLRHVCMNIGKMLIMKKFGIKNGLKIFDESRFKVTVTPLDEYTDNLEHIGKEVLNNI